MEQIPVYKGMALVNEEKTPKRDKLVLGVKKTYVINAPIEEAVAFYEKELGISKRFEQAPDPYDLNVGEWVKPTIEVYFWDDGMFIDRDYGEDGSLRLAWIRKELNTRKKDKENLWMESASCTWYYRDGEDRMTIFHIMFQDLSIDHENKKYAPKTEVIFEVTKDEWLLDAFRG